MMISAFRRGSLLGRVFFLVPMLSLMFLLGCGGGGGGGGDSPPPEGPSYTGDLLPPDFSSRVSAVVIGQKIVGNWRREGQIAYNSPADGISITANREIRSFFADGTFYHEVTGNAQYEGRLLGIRAYASGRYAIGEGEITYSMVVSSMYSDDLNQYITKNVSSSSDPDIVNWVSDSILKLTHSDGSSSYSSLYLVMSSPSDPLRGSTPAPGTDMLGNIGQVLTYPQMAGYSTFLSSITFEIPTPTRQERYGLVLTNVANTTENRSVTVAPLSYVSGSNRAASLVTAGPDAPTLGQRQPNQIWAEQEMRRRRSLPPAINDAGPQPQAAVRAANNSGEQLFDEVTFNLYSRSVYGMGTDYTRRTCVLRRIGQFCKIFVDKNPSPARGLSAVTGPNAITEAELDQFVRDFDTVAWPLLRDGYGPTWDVDQDGKVTYVFSPLYTELGFAGLFDTAHLEPSHPQTNQRDMVVIFTPDVSGQAGSTWDHERWLPAARETMVHECQHIINYSAHMHYNNTGFEEAVWLDEALSVSAEARFRINRGDPAGEDRFNSWASGRPNSYALTDFSWDVAKYGMLGLWGHYLFEQGGTESVRLLVQGNVQGKNNIDARFASRGGMEGLFPDWAAAVFSEGMRRQGLVNYGALDDRHKFKANLDLNLAFTSVPFGSSATTSVRGYGASFLYLTPPSGYNQNSFRFVVYAPDTPNLRCVLMRLQ